MVLHMYANEMGRAMSVVPEIEVRALDYTEFPNRFSTVCLDYGCNFEDKFKTLDDADQAKEYHMEWHDGGMENG